MGTLRAATGRWLSVRVRITALTIVIVAAALSAAAAGVLRFQRDALTDNVETALELRSDDIASLIQSGRLPAELEQSDVEVAGIQVLDSRGTIVSSTSNLAGANAISNARPLLSTTATERRHDVPIDDEPFLVLARTVEADGEAYVVYVAGSLDPVNESTDALASLLWAGVPALTLLVGFGTWLVVGRALAPVESMRREVAGIGAGDLGRRLPEPGLADEIGRLARTMNAMLARLDEANQQQERFVEDAAHELRSPLASMRTQLEVAVSAGEAPQADALLGEVVRLQRLADGLLVLARSGAAQRATPVLVDLDDIVLAEAHRARSETGKTIDVGAVSAGQVRGHQDDLRRVVRNLLDNACRHASSRVTLALREDGDGVTLTVTDDGPGVPPAQAEHIFERFARADSARDREAGGAGLGLAITRAIVAAHGGTIALDPTFAGGARFVARLPRPTPP